MLVLLLTIAIFRNFRHSLFYALHERHVLVMMGAAILFKQKINFLKLHRHSDSIGIGMDYA
jgi:predicted RND superfamily exporter protein